MKPMFGIGSRKNALLHIMDASSFFMGVSLCSFSVIVPSYVRNFTDSKVLLALIPVIVDVGANLPQTLSVYLAWRGKRGGKRDPVKDYWVLETLHRFTFVLIGAAILLFSRDVVSSLVSFYALFALSNLVWGFSGPLWVDVLSCTIPDGQRAYFLGKRDLISRIVGILSSLSLPLILGIAPFPYNYGALFIISGVLFTSGILPARLFTSILPLKEPHEEHTGRGYFSFLKSGFSMILGNRKLLPFLAVFWALSVSRITYAFFTPYVMDRMIIRFPAGEKNFYVSVLNNTLLVSLALTSFFVGRLIHRLGHKATFLIGTICFLLMNAGIVLFPYFPVALAGTLLMALFMNTAYLVSLNAIMDHTAPEFRSTITSFSNTLNTAFIALFSSIGTGIAGFLNYEGAFLFTAACLLPLVFAITRLDLKRRQPA